jgi:hypothetical protein
MGVNLREYTRAVGLDELDGITVDEAAQDFMPAAVVGLAAGDIVALHPPYSGQKAELYGETRFDKGKVAKAVGESAIENVDAPGVVYDFQTFAAEYFYQPGSPFRTFGNSGAVSVRSDEVVVDGISVALSRRPEVVVDFDACLTGRNYQVDQIRMVAGLARPFVYTPIANSHFMHEAIKRYYGHLGLDVEAFISSKSLFDGREGDDAMVVKDIIIEQKRATGSTEAADVSLCTGAQHADPENLKYGVKLARTLLKEDGLMVIRALAEPTTDEIGADMIAEWAFESGFDEKDAVIGETVFEPTSGAFRSGHIEDRKMKGILLGKR